MIEDAGAPREEYRVLTHTRPSRDVLEVYVQRSWTSLCATAQRIKLPWDENVIAIGAAVGEAVSRIRVKDSCQGWLRHRQLTGFSAPLLGDAETQKPFGHA